MRLLLYVIIAAGLQAQIPELSQIHVVLVLWKRMIRLEIMFFTNLRTPILGSTLLMVAAAAVAQQKPDLAPAVSALQEFGAVCGAAGTTRLWGTTLCGRLVLVDPGSRAAVATPQDPDRKFEAREGFFIGTLPPDLMIANTSIRWDGEEWAVVLLPLSSDSYQRLRLLAHESFHRLQPTLGLNAGDKPSDHLDSESGRLWLRMELRALAQALRTDGAASRTAAKDALAFRAARHRLHPNAEALESALEIQEGLAEYTGAVVAMEATGEFSNRVARAVESFEDQRSFMRSFAYATGPALGLLLDRFHAGWRKKVKSDSRIAALLAQSLGFRTSGDPVREAELRGQRYGLRAVAQVEQASAKRTQALAGAYRVRFLDGPVLEFPKQEVQRSFNPNNLFPLGEHGTVYPTGTFASRWGKLQVDNTGALLSPDNASIRVSAPPDIQARPLTGPGWRLELAPGWTIRPSTRQGSFVLAPE